MMAQAMKDRAMAAQVMAGSGNDGAGDGILGNDGAGDGGSGEDGSGDDGSGDSVSGDDGAENGSAGDQSLAIATRCLPARL